MWQHRYRGMLMIGGGAIIAGLCFVCRTVGQHGRPPAFTYPPNAANQVTKNDLCPSMGCSRSVTYDVRGHTDDLATFYREQQYICAVETNAYTLRWADLGAPAWICSKHIYPRKYISVVFPWADSREAVPLLHVHMLAHWDDLAGFWTGPD